MSAAPAAVTRKRKLLHLSLSDAARERAVWRVGAIVGWLAIFYWMCAK